MWQTIRNVVENSSTVLLITRSLDETDQFADKIIVIEHERIVADDIPDKL
ncbi:MAG: hypothetical protein LBH38_03920 [Holosporales bacterium]|jgi:ABC-type multidrug transport system ATPase subunit|nr:hypothetical protein [Holosporales bacterium]